MATHRSGGSAKRSHGEYRKERARRVSRVASFLAVVSGSAMLLALPDWVAAGSPLGLIAMTLAIPLLACPALFAVTTVGCAAMQIFLGRQLDKTYSAIELIAGLMPVRAAEIYRSDMAGNARGIGEAPYLQWRGRRLDGERAKHQAFRSDLRANAPVTVVESWRSRGAHRMGRGSKVGRGVVLACGTLGLGIALSALTDYLLTLDSGADIADILSLQVSIISSVVAIYGIVRSKS